MFCKPTSQNNALSGRISFNSLTNLFARDLGLIPTKLFITFTNSRRLEDIRLSKYRSIAPLKHSVTWLSLDSVENRFLLAAKSDGNFACIDMFEKQTEKNHQFKHVFDSAKFVTKNAHAYSCSCVQWYPMDSGMFFTSGMDEKFKVWDTNSLQVIDEYSLKHKIYSHHISLLMSCQNKSLISLALDNGQVRFIDLNSGSFSHTLKAHPQGYCVCVQWSPTNPNVLASGGSDGKIALWDIRSAKACLFYLDYEKTSNKINNNSKNSSASSRSIAHGGPIVSLTYTPDGHNIISLGKDNRLQLWNSQNGVNTLTNYGKIPLNSAVAESSLQMACTDLCVDKYVYVPSNSNLLMYNVLEGSLRSTYKGHFESVNCCMYNPVLNEVYTGSKDRNILIWTPEKQLNVFENLGNTKNLSRNCHSILSNTGRSSTATSQTSLKRPRDNWSDDEG